jgi:3-oxoacyl-[acyl-carrier protein] reductase
MTDVRSAVVTGGATGIGREVARSFAADGWRVVVVGRRRAVLDEVAGEFPGIDVVQGDLSLPTDVERVAEEVVASVGVVDVLVANAGGTNHGEQTTVAQVAEHWLTTMSQNVLSAVLLEHALRPHLRRPGGRVIVISSFAARSLAGNPAYGASKAALNRWVLALGDQIGEIGGTANAVAAGFVPDTGLYGGSLTVDRIERFSSGIGVRRPGVPADIASAVRWLASPEAAFVNGTVVEVDGGRRRQQ